MAKADVFAGACGYSAVIKVKKLEGRSISLEISSECEMLRAMAEELGELDWGRGVLEDFASSRIYKAADKHLRHASCPVPSAILKTIEVEIGIALPNRVQIEIDRE